MPLSKSKKSEYDSRKYSENLKLVQDHKLARGCADCGYNKHHAGLELDHIPGKGKKNKVSCLLSGATQRILEELEKCEVVCGTCHNIRTWTRKQSKFHAPVV